MKQHYLSTMTRAGVNLPQNPTGRVYHSKVHPLPRFFPILAEKARAAMRAAGLSADQIPAPEDDGDGNLCYYFNIQH